MFLAHCTPAITGFSVVFLSHTGLIHILAFPTVLVGVVTGLVSLDQNILNGILALICSPGNDLD